MIKRITFDCDDGIYAEVREQLRLLKTVSRSASMRKIMHEALSLWLKRQRTVRHRAPSAQATMRMRGRRPKSLMMRIVSEYVRNMIRIADKHYVDRHNGPPTSFYKSKNWDEWWTQ